MVHHDLSLSGVRVRPFCVPSRQVVFRRPCGDQLSESLKIIMIRHVLGKLQLARGTPCPCPFLCILVFSAFSKRLPICSRDDFWILYTCPTLLHSLISIGHPYPLSTTCSPVHAPLRSTDSIPESPALAVRRHDSPQFPRSCTNLLHRRTKPRTM